MKNMVSAIASRPQCTPIHRRFAEMKPLQITKLGHYVLETARSLKSEKNQDKAPFVRPDENTLRYDSMQNRTNSNSDIP